MGGGDCVHVQMRSLKKTGLDNSNINSGVLGERSALKLVEVLAISFNYMFVHIWGDATVRETGG